MDLIFVPFHDYKLCQREGFRTRDAHFLKSFAKSEKIDRIIVVNRPTSLVELLLTRKKLRTQGNLLMIDQYCYLTQVSDKIFCIDFLIFDILSVVRKKRMWIPTAYENKKVAEFFEKSVALLNVHNCIAYTSTPLTIPFFSEKKFSKVIFDAVDNLLKYNIFSTKEKSILEKLYSYAYEKSDLFICNSQDSLRYFDKKKSPKAIVIPNGVDVKEFRDTVMSVPEDMRKIPHPIVGYGGKMQVMFDLKLLEKLSIQFPDVSFVLVGKLLDKNYMSSIHNFKNVYYLGDKVYEEYKSYIMNFDVCMIPYRLDTQHGGDPIKFYEYMASNKPIVSTEIGEIKKYENSSNIFIVDTHEKFLDAIQTMIANLPGEKISHSIPPEITWDFKIDRVLKILK
jgi:teichuronic acid biosynthesis glycosyltransferase TuaH